MMAPPFSGLVCLLFWTALHIVVPAIPPVQAQTNQTNSSCPPAEKTVEKKARVGDDVVLPCGVSPESKEALSNRTVVLWNSPSLSNFGNGGGNSIPIVSQRKTADGHRFDQPESTGRVHINTANASLRLLNVTLNDRTDFFCKIYRGAICFYIVQVRLIVVDRPGPPVNVTVESLSETSIRIRWQPGPDNYVEIENYEITVTPEEPFRSEASNLVKKVLHPTTEVTFEHLMPYSYYKIKIRARNEMGLSDFARPEARHRTLEGTPTIGPVIFNVSATNTSITMEVRPVDITEKQMQGVFRGYIARIHLGSDIIDEKSINEMKKIKQWIHFKGLKPYTEYSVSVCLRNGRNHGEFISRRVRTAEGLPGKPRIFDTESVSEFKFVVHWEPPKQKNGVISGYVIRVKEKDTSQEQILRTYDINRHMLEVKNLKPYNIYLVSVAAETKAGTGDFDGPWKVLTDIGQPGKPKLTDARVNLTALGVSLDWLSPDKLKKPELTSYMLCWSDGTDRSEEPCIHAQTKRPKQVAFMYEISPGLSDTDLPKMTPRYRATIPWENLSRVWQRVTEQSGSKSAKLHFTVYGRSRGLYCHDGKVGTTTTSVKVTSRRLLRAVITRNLKQPCYYSGEHSNSIVVTIQNNEAMEMMKGLPKDPTISDNDNSVLVLALVLSLIIIMVASFVGFFFVCRRCGSHRGYDLALNNGLERVNSIPRGLPCGETLEPLEPALMPTILPYSECGVPSVDAHAFPDHVAKLHADSEAGFSVEFDEIDKKQQLNSWPDCVARLPENAQKNRYTNIFPYDHTRVRVMHMGLKRSDYINANFIDGYDRKNAYIAAQGPMPATFEDFWQMIWEQRTNTIVMISNLIERGRLKCDQYWPTSFGQEGSQQYGRILVTLNRQVELAYYIVREMTVRNLKSKKCASKFRNIYHYQYTDWPDFAVPESPLPVLVFIRKTVSHVVKSSGPILVHCSAGVGRTGTYLCIESQIRQFEKEKNFNVRGFLEHIRQQRMKLVQTEEQYAFIHDALMEHYLCPYHEIPRAELTAYVKCLKEVEPCSCVRLEREFQLCVSYRPQEWELLCSMKPVNENKSRSDIYPVFMRQVALPAEPGVDGSNYINASYLQGYWRRDEFIVTQHPFEHTVTDFWKMVWDQNSSQVILLTTNAPNMEYPCFWPSNPDDTKEAGYLRVGILHRRDYQHSTHLKFLVSSTREDYSLVSNIWLYKQWPNSTDNVLDLFHFIRQVQVEREKTGPFIVIDELGGSRAGIFCALNTLMDQLDNENCVDVYFVFKMYHRQRPGIFQCQADLEFIYDAMERYAREPPPVMPMPPHSSNSSHHSSPGTGPPPGNTGDANGGQFIADSLTRAGRLTPNGVTMLGGANDQTVSYYSNGGTLPRVVVTSAPNNNGSATLDSRASRGECGDNGDVLT